MDLNPKFIALHKHWLTADAVKQFVGAAVPTRNGETIPKALAEASQQFSGFLRLAVWYSLVFVVVEGYQELKGEDPDVDELLKNTEFVNQLRRFRNAVFHYQEDPLSMKLITFITTPETESWIGRLHSAMEKYLRKHLPIDELVAKFKESGDR